MWHCTRWQVPLPRSRKNKHGDPMSTGEQMWYSIPCLVVWRSSHSGPGCTSNSRLRSQEWKLLWNLVQCVAQFPASTSFRPKKSELGYFRWDFNSSSTEAIRQKNKHLRYQLMVLVPWGFWSKNERTRRDFVQVSKILPANFWPFHRLHSEATVRKKITRLKGNSSRSLIIFWQNLHWRWK